MEVHILTLGAIVQRLKVPDRKGVLADVVLGFDDLEPYQACFSKGIDGCLYRMRNSHMHEPSLLSGSQAYSFIFNDSP